MRKRVLDISCYLGLARVFWLLDSDRWEKTSRGYHCRQALALSFLLFLSLFIFTICFSLHQMILYLSRDLFQSLPLEISFYVLGALLAAWLVLWAAGAASAALGIAPQIPLLSRTAASKRLMLFSVGWTLLLQACLGIIAAGAIHSTQLARAEAAPADVYMLYDDMGYIPQWVFTLGFYRVSLAATDRWGDGAEVKTFDRLSSATEHLLWLLGDGPKTIFTLK